MYLVTVLLVASSFDWTLAYTFGSCAQARMCCDGKDASCVVESKPHQLSNLDPRSRSVPCYCDHGCLDVGDCCPDFKEYCGVMDCKVGNWSNWSSCDVSCGTGSSVRSREIIHPESNGGQECPALEEKKTCRATKCSKRHRDRISALKESAMLLPGKYLKKMARNTYDVRSNLKSYKKPKTSQSYCVVFQVDKAMRSCLSDKDTRDLVRGNTICVQCNSKATKSQLGGRCTGHGTEGKRTRFKNVMTPKCHGRWTRLELVEGEECPCKGGPDFVFV